MVQGAGRELSCEVARRGLKWRQPQGSPMGGFGGSLQHASPGIGGFTVLVQQHLSSHSDLSRVSEGELSLNRIGIPTLFEGLSPSFLEGCPFRTCGTLLTELRGLPSCFLWFGSALEESE